MAKPSKKQAFTYGGLVVAAAGVSTLIATWDDLGLPFPLTEHSPVIQEFGEFDEEHELELAIQQAQIKHNRNEQLSDYVTRDGLKLKILKAKESHTPLEMEIMVQYELQIRKNLAELEGKPE